MGKFLLFLCIVFVIVFLCKQLYKLGKTHGTTPTEKPKANPTELDKRIDELNTMIDNLENNLPSDLEKNESERLKLMAELERVKDLKKRFSKN